MHKILIPSNIEHSHILQALEEIDRNDYPENRESTGYYLHYKGKNYPPKLVISLANKYANKKDLPSEEFSGGDEANSFLKSRMFEIITKDSIIDKGKVIQLLADGCIKRN